MRKGKLDTIREYVSRTTPGPWRTFTQDGYHLIGYAQAHEAKLRLGLIPDTQAAADADFAAQARTDLPLLLAEVEELTALAIDALSRHGHGVGCHPSEGRHSEACQVARRQLATLRHAAEVPHPPAMCPLCAPEPT